MAGFALNWPNALSAARLVGSPLLLWMSPQLELHWTIAIFAVLGLTDWLDGFLARRWNQTTEFGSMLDGLADLVFYPCAAGLLLLWFPQYLLPNTPFIILTGITLLAVIGVSWKVCGRIVLLHTHLSRCAAVFVYLAVLASLVTDTTLLIRAIALLYTLAFLEGMLIFWKRGAVPPDTRSLFSTP
jgi:phosphatidylglycerophosphate synthase